MGSLKIGVFGGTFNPVHRGHEKTAIEFYEKFNIDKLLIIPTFVTPQKKMDVGVSPFQRFEMCKLAFEAEKYARYNIEVSDIEIKKAGKSYSVETVRLLREMYGAEESIIYFLVGTDMFLSIESWYRYRELLDMCVLVVASRYEFEAFDNVSGVLDIKTETRIEWKKKRMTEEGLRVELLENMVFEISSTELRENIRKSDADSEIISQWVNDDVVAYIKRKKLYVNGDL